MLYIATLDEIKTVVGISDSTDDSLLNLWLTALQGRFETRCGRGLLYTSGVTELFDGGKSSLYPYRSPIDSVTTIHVSTDQEWDADSLLEIDDYRIDYDRGRIVYGTSGLYSWPSGLQNIRVVYAGGLIKSDQSAAPNAKDENVNALRDAYFYQAAYEWRNRERLGLADVSQNGVSVQAGSQPSLAKKGMTFLPVVEMALQRLTKF